MSTTETEPPKNVIARAITMRNFATIPYINKHCVGPEQEIHLSTVIGRVYSTLRKAGQLPSGETKESIVIEGEFEAVNQQDGEVISAGALFLPDAFAELVEKRMKDQPAGDVLEFAIEIWCAPTGRAIPFKYVIRSLMTMQGPSALDAIKRKLGSRSKGFLPPSPTLVPKPVELFVETTDAETAGLTADDGAIASSRKRGSSRLRTSNALVYPTAALLRAPLFMAGLSPLLLPSP